MDCGVIILWLPADLEDVQSADVSERGMWSICGNTLVLDSPHYYNFFDFTFIFIHTLRGHKYDYEFFSLFVQ